MQRKMKFLSTLMKNLNLPDIVKVFKDMSDNWKTAAASEPFIGLSYDCIGINVPWLNLSLVKKIYFV